VAHGPQNVWICEVGSSRLNGTFENFLQNIAASGKLENVNVQFQHYSNAVVQYCHCH
jgi:hypothetical protein